MVTEYITDEERQLIAVLVSKSLIEVRSDPELKEAAKELFSILRKISGTDKRIEVHS